MIIKNHRQTQASHKSNRRAQKTKSFSTILTHEQHPDKKTSSWHQSLSKRVPANNEEIGQIICGIKKHEEWIIFLGSIWSGYVRFAGKFPKSCKNVYFWRASIEESKSNKMWSSWCQNDGLGISFLGVLRLLKSEVKWMRYG